MQRVSSESLSLWAILQKIKSLEDQEVEVVFSAVSPLLENLLGLKVLKEAVERSGKKITFLFEDRNFLYLSPFLNRALVKDEIGSEILPPPEEESLASPTVSRPGFRLKFDRRLLLFFVPVFLIGVSALSLYYLVTAKVTIYLDSESLAKNLEVLAQPGEKSLSREPPSIPASEITMSLAKSESSPSSGRKKVGEKATGKVTIYNKTTLVVNLPVGTILTKARINGDDLRFLTKVAVTVPARVNDAQAVSGYLPGTAEVDVTAESFGSDYNLTANSNFTLAGKPTSDFVAQNLGDLGGGSERQLTVVTSDDQRKLLETTAASLKDELKKSILAKVVSGQAADEESISFELVGKSFDKGVGEEADRLTLNLEVKAKALTFWQSDLKSLAARLLTSFVPEGYELFGSDQEVEIVKTEVSLPRLKILARAKGFIVPKIDPDEIKRKILGKGVDPARSYLNSLNKISSYSLQRTPDLSFFAFLPFRAKNLKIEVIRK